MATVDSMKIQRISHGRLAVHGSSGNWACFVESAPKPISPLLHPRYSNVHVFAVSDVELFSETTSHPGVDATTGYRANRVRHIRIHFPLAQLAPVISSSSLTLTTSYPRRRISGTTLCSIGTVHARRS